MYFGSSLLFRVPLSLFAKRVVRFFFFLFSVSGWIAFVRVLYCRVISFLSGLVGSWSRCWSNPICMYLRFWAFAHGLMKYEPNQLNQKKGGCLSENKGYK